MTTREAGLQNLDSEILGHAGEWLGAGMDVWLCTVVKTYGSSPRPVGSLMVYADSHHRAGSLSGGCVEDELLALLDDGGPDVVPAILQYGVTRADSERLGLPCGGTLDVLVERLAASAASHVADLRRITSSLAQRRCIQRKVDLRTGIWQTQAVPAATPLQLDAGQLQQCFGPVYQLLLVGAGELARWLARFALSLDYRVMVTDPRAELLAQWDVAGVECIGGMPDDVVRDHAADPYSIVITLTHDPRIDDMALLEALVSEAWYVGALGSQRTSEKRRQRLRQLDVDDAAVARLRAPVGLAIGSKRPPEIAIAILAELTQLRAQRERGHG